MRPDHSNFSAVGAVPAPNSLPCVAGCGAGVAPTEGRSTARAHPALSEFRLNVFERAVAIVSANAVAVDSPIARSCSGASKLAPGRRPGPFRTSRSVGSRTPEEEICKATQAQQQVARVQGLVLPGKSDN